MLKTHEKIILEQFFFLVSITMLYFYTRYGKVKSNFEIIYVEMHLEFLFQLERTHVDVLTNSLMISRYNF